MQISLKKLFDAFPPFINVNKDTKKDGIHGNVDVIHSVLNYTALQIKEISNFGSEVWFKNEARADLILINDKAQTGMIIELKYNDSVDKALQQTYEYLSIFENHKRIKLVKCLGISISKDKTVKIKAKEKFNKHNSDQLLCLSQKK